MNKLIIILILLSNFAFGQYDVEELQNTKKEILEEIKVLKDSVEYINAIIESLKPIKYRSARTIEDSINKVQLVEAIRWENENRERIQKEEEEIKKIKEEKIKNKLPNLIKKYGEKIGKKLYFEELWLGMTREMVIDSRGLPYDNNRSVGSWGVHNQWVYDNVNLYFENGILTSWQD